MNVDTMLWIARLRLVPKMLFYFSGPFATKLTGADHGYRLVLPKQIYEDDYDWKVWRLIEDFSFKGIEHEVRFLCVLGTFPLIPINEG